MKTDEGLRSHSACPNGAGPEKDPAGTTGKGGDSHGALIGTTIIVNYRRTFLS